MARLRRLQRESGLDPTERSSVERSGALQDLLGGGGGGGGGGDPLAAQASEDTRVGGGGDWGTSSREWGHLLPGDSRPGTAPTPPPPPPPLSPSEPHPAPAAAAFSDEKGANRESRVWHGGRK
jgi:hypothetical protein